MSDWLRLARRYWRELAVLVLFVLPIAALPVFGVLWLFERHWVTPWLGAMLGVTVIAIGAGRLWRGRDHGITVPPASPDMAPAEQAARAALAEIVAGVAAKDIESREALQDLVRRTVTAVARAWNPEAARAELHFTLPEALLLTEQVARRLRGAVLRDLPVLRHVPVRWLPDGHMAYGRLVKAYGGYRVLRAAFSPLNALVSELRSVLLDKVTDSVTEAAKRQVAAVLVREVGEAAIQLYSGRLRRDLSEIRADAPEPVREEAARPITILLAGQVNAGKSSLVNALSGRHRAVASPLPGPPGFPAFALDEASAGELRLIDSAGLGPAPSEDWLAEAERADLILWVAAAHRAARAADQRALRALEARLGTANRRRPPVVLALAHVDRLSPAGEWAPPYDPKAGSRPKERAMRDALAAAVEDLAIPAWSAVPVCTLEPETAWNIPALWAAIHAALPGARQAQLDRLLRGRAWWEAWIDSARTVAGLPRSVRDAIR
jgi:hypothetical protein